MADESVSFGQDRERLKVLRRRLWFWIPVVLVAQAIALYGLFGQVVPAAREYRQIKERLCLEVIRANGAREDHGCRAIKLSAPQTGWLPGARPADALIINAGEAFLVDAWQNLVELEIMRFHAIGTGTVAPAETDTALGTELTTQYNPDNTRATGSLGEASASVFRTVGTNTVDATVTIGEWGLLSQAATAGGTLWSRALVSPTIGLNSGDSLQTTYDLTVE